MECIQDDSDEHGQAYEFSDLDGERMYFADDDLHQVMQHVAWNAHLRASLNAIYCLWSATNSGSKSMVEGACVTSMAYNSLRQIWRVLAERHEWEDDRFLGKTANETDPLWFTARGTKIFRKVLGSMGKTEAAKTIRPRRKPPASAAYGPILKQLSSLSTRHALAQLINEARAMRVDASRENGPVLDLLRQTNPIQCMLSADETPYGSVLALDLAAKSSLYGTRLDNEDRYNNMVLSILTSTTKILSDESIARAIASDDTMSDIYCVHEVCYEILEGLRSSSSLERLPWTMSTRDAALHSITSGPTKTLCNTGSIIG